MLRNARVLDKGNFEHPAKLVIRSLESVARLAHDRTGIDFGNRSMGRRSQLGTRLPMLVLQLAWCRGTLVKDPGEY